MWSLIRRRPDEAAPTSEDGRYAVCPSCCERSPVVDSAPTLRCRRCGAVFAIAWSDSPWRAFEVLPGRPQDRKSTRLNSSHSQISYAVFCLKKKKKSHVDTTRL